jgi:hypothetical protein
MYMREFQSAGLTNVPCVCDLVRVLVGTPIEIFPNPYFTAALLSDRGLVQPLFETNLGFLRVCRHFFAIAMHEFNIILRISKPFFLCRFKESP